MSYANFPSQCKSYDPGQDTSNVGDMAQNILSKLSGATQGCDLSAMYAAVGAQTSLLGLANASVSGQVNTMNKAGCQVLNALVGNYLNACYVSKCIILNDNRSTVVENEIDTTIDIVAEGGSIIENVNCGPDSEITINTSIKAKVIQYVSDEAKANVTTAVQLALDNTVAQLGTIKDGFMSTSSGSQSITGIQNVLKNTNATNEITNHINNINDYFTTKTNLSFAALANSKIINVIPCHLHIDSTIDAQVASMVSSVYSTDICDSVSSFLKSSAAQTITQTNEGTPDVVGDMFKNNWMIIIGVIVLVVVGIIVLKKMKNKKSKK